MTLSRTRELEPRGNPNVVNLFNNVAVKMADDEAHLVAIVGQGGAKSGTHHAGAENYDVSHTVIFLNSKTSNVRFTRTNRRSRSHAPYAGCGGWFWTWPWQRSLAVPRMARAVTSSVARTVNKPPRKAPRMESTLGRPRAMAITCGILRIVEGNADNTFVDGIAVVTPTGIKKAAAGFADNALRAQVGQLARR